MATVKSSMAGTVVRVLVGPGDSIGADQDVVVLESMKMEMMVQSPIKGQVKAVLVAADDYVEEGQALIELA